MLFLRSSTIMARSNAMAFATNNHYRVNKLSRMVHSFGIHKRNTVPNQRKQFTTTTTTTLKASSSIIAGKQFVSVDECVQIKKDDPSVVFVDGSWHLDKSRNGKSEYETGPRIAGAKYFDIDDISSKGPNLNPKGLPHMAPPKKLFELAMDALGIANSDTIIIYGTEGCMFTPRAWYTIRAMGHDISKVHLMQGSIKEWEEKGGPLEHGPIVSIRADDLLEGAVYTTSSSTGTSYQAKDPVRFCGIDEVLRVVGDNIAATSSDSIILDARGAARFKAEVPEPREGLRGGHMPGSVNLPFTDLLEPNDATKFKPVDELKQAFREAGVDVNTDQKIICTCGSGVTACHIAAALEECGRDFSDTVIFDGSWIEYGSDPDTPIVT